MTEIASIPPPFGLYFPVKPEHQPKLAPALQAAAYEAIGYLQSRGFNSKEKVVPRAESGAVILGSGSIEAQRPTLALTKFSVHGLRQAVEQAASFQTSPVTLSIKRYDWPARNKRGDPGNVLVAELDTDSNATALLLRQRHHVANALKEMGAGFLDIAYPDAVPMLFVPWTARITADERGAICDIASKHLGEAGIAELHLSALSLKARKSRGVKRRTRDSRR